MMILIYACDHRQKEFYVDPIPIRIAVGTGPGARTQ